MAHDLLNGDLEAWSLLSVALDPVAPPAHCRERLLAEISGRARHLPFQRGLQAHFDLSEADAAALLARIGEASAWTAGVAPILGFLHFRPGPRLGRAHCGFVRMKRGMQIPAHRHRDSELTYVLEGVLLDGEGHRYGPGAAIEMPADSVHTLYVSPDQDALVATAQGRIHLLGI
jgi:quercetin dioxygenase-like cupin family protein